MKFTNSQKIFLLYFAFTIIVIVLCLLLGFTKPPSKYLKWEERKLQFYDFQLIEGPIFRNIAATTCTGIMMIYSLKDSSYHAEAIVDTEKSMWSNRHTRNIPYLLNHEQKHFDITEYIVRRLNQDLIGKDSLMQLKLFKVYEEQLDIMQKLYDAETNHSMDTLQQNTWNSIVDNLLLYQR